MFISFGGGEKKKGCVRDPELQFESLACWRCAGPHFLPALILGHTEQSIWKCGKGSGLGGEGCIVRLAKMFSFHSAASSLLCEKATVCPLLVMS